MTSRIMVVDDEHEIADLIEVYLKNEGFIVYKFYCSNDALECAAKTELDITILDVMMPDIDGLTVCRTIRESSTYPIIMLMAKKQEIDKITGLTLGADDYVTKPFRPLELIARVKAQLRRYKKYNQSQAERKLIITYSGLMLDKDSHECTLNEIPLCLAPGLSIYADPDKLARVFNNILKNAATYSTPNSIIEIAARSEAGAVKVAFKNKGARIPAEKLKAIFERFYRLDAPRSINTGVRALV